MENDPMIPSAEVPPIKNGHPGLRVIAAIIVIFIIAGVAYWLMKGSAEAPQDGATKIQGQAPAGDTVSPQPSAQQPDAIPPAPETPVENTTPSPRPASTVNQSFTVTASNFTYDLKEIRVNKGDTVTITLVNNEGMHDMVLDAFGVKTAQIREGETATITFAADKTGTFEYYCSIGNHRTMGMKGNLIVQ